MQIFGENPFLSFAIRDIAQRVVANAQNFRAKEL
jgi:hypothetical protein